MRKKFLNVLLTILIAAIFVAVIKGKDIQEKQDINKEFHHVDEYTEQVMPKIHHIIVGTDYNIALCEDGTVWSWGNNDDGKLGIAVSTIRNPQRIEELKDIIKIVDGGQNIFALSESGEVYFWGRGLEAIWKEQTNNNNIIYTPFHLEELAEIVDIDAKNDVMFALDGNGKLYSLGLYMYDYSEHKRSDLLTILSDHEELGKDIAGIVTGAGSYHYFIRKDGTIFSIMDYENDGYPLYAFIFPAAEISESGESETYYRPEELDNIFILNDRVKEGYLIYYNLPGINEIEMASSDGYTLFVSRTDGTLWYWDSDRIKYHDNELALTNPESGEESTAGSFMQINTRGILGLGEDVSPPHIVDMQSSMENTVFLTSDGSVFISWYKTYCVEDVSYFNRGNSNPQKQPLVQQIEDMELKTLVFEKLMMSEIVSISSDGKGNFAAVDTNGTYFRIVEGEPVCVYREYLASERWHRRFTVKKNN